MTEHYGLYEKYAITNNATGMTVSGAFVLKPETDAHARAALMTYAASIYKANPQLATDIRKWVMGFMEPDSELLADIEPVSAEEAAEIDAYFNASPTDDRTEEEADIESKAAAIGEFVRLSKELVDAIDDLDALELIPQDRGGGEFFERLRDDISTAAYQFDPDADDHGRDE